jgi:hypothetical protein
MIMSDVRDSFDPLISALAAEAVAEERTVERILAAVDAGDTQVIRDTLGCGLEEASALLARLRPPDAATRRVWLEEWIARARAREV